MTEFFVVETERGPLVLKHFTSMRRHWWSVIFPDTELNVVGITTPDYRSELSDSQKQLLLKANKVIYGPEIDAIEYFVGKVIYLTSKGSRYDRFPNHDDRYTTTVLSWKNYCELKQLK